MDIFQKTVISFRKYLSSNHPELSENSSSDDLQIDLLPDEAGDVDVDEGGHEILAVKPVHDAAVAWDGVCKILKREREKKKRVKERGESPARLRRSA